VTSIRSQSSGAADYARREQDDTMRQLEVLRARGATGAYVSPLDFARAHARLSDVEGAFESLAASFDDRAAGLVFLQVDPAWDNIRHDPRFRDAVRRVGLPTAG